MRIHLSHVNLLRKRVLLVVGVSLTSLAAAMPPTDGPPTTDKAATRESRSEQSQSSLAARADRDSCIARGGLWMSEHPVGFLKKTGCNEPTSDKGKICNDSSECESACVSDRSSPSGGRCYGYRFFFGCGKRVASGGRVAILCID